MRELILSCFDVEALKKANPFVASLSNGILSMIVFGILVTFWEVIVIAMIVASPIIPGLFVMVSEFLSPSYQRNLWNRYG